MALPLQVEHKEWEHSMPVVKWKRKVTSQYNEELGHWEPIPLVVRSEDHILYVMEIKELVELSLGDEQSSLDSHVLRLKSQFPQAKLIYLIEGMVPWSRKNKGNKNKQFAAAVSSHLATGAGAPANGQRKKKIPDYIDEEIIEEALMQLQISHEALIHHATVRIETAEWIIAFTQHISTIPYRYAFMSSFLVAFR
jgi:crossover junction endonuclease EME1